jgi:hypothetical protein
VRAEVGLESGVWISTRVTVAAPDPVALDHRARRVRDMLACQACDEGPSASSASAP